MKQEYKFEIFVALKKEKKKKLLWTAATSCKRWKQNRGESIVPVGRVESFDDR